MSDLAIRIEGLGKRYRLGAGAGGGAYSYRALRDVMTGALSAPFRGLRRLAGGNAAPPRRADDDILWALRDISIEIKQGEVVGVFGRNGAGKSTLLKVLSRITEPTEGRVEIHGRLGSLLEVGTGFHPELTGRENIFLNGAILGMSKREITSKFDEIVAFSEIEKFLDTPVKRYSSGMYVRLAFAVAAHLDPEILLVDEVLAVGDVQFQEKCLGKMEDVSKTGRTVLFVSHNMVAIQRLCRRGVLVDGGRVVFDGPAERAVATYLAQTREVTRGQCLFSGDGAPGDESVRLRSVCLTRANGQRSDEFRIDEGLTVETEFVVLQTISGFHMYIRVFTSTGVLVFGSGDWDSLDGDATAHELAPGTYSARCRMPGNLLNHGRYSLTVNGQIPQGRYVFVEENVVGWDITEEGGVGGAVSLLRPGVIRPKLAWTVEQLPAGRAQPHARKVTE